VRGADVPSVSLHSLTEKAIIATCILATQNLALKLLLNGVIPAVYPAKKWNFQRSRKPSAAV
jgi:hypothetical protein